MKTKAKLTLAISVLSAVVLSAGVTSTFAWFTTKATANFNSATLTVNTLSELKIKAYSVSPGGAVTGNDSNSLTGIAAALGSVSTKDGQNIYAPTALGANTFGDVTSAGFATGNPYAGYVKYNLYVYTEATDQEGKGLKLTITATNKDGGAIESPLVDWYRVAVYTSAASGDTTDAHDDTKVTPDNALTKVYSNAEQTTAESNPGAKYVASLDGTTPNYDYRATEAISGATNVTIPGFTTSKTERVYRHLTVAVWMEGCAADDQNTAGGKTLKVNFEFSLA